MNSWSGISLKNKLFARIFTAFPALAAAWGRRLIANPDPIPWATPQVALAQARVALVTTGGVHLLDQPPFVMTDQDGDPSFREVPISSLRHQLTITHDYYDHRDAENDLNLVFPAELLQEIAGQGGIGSIHEIAYSLMGHIGGLHLPTLTDQTAPEIAQRLFAAKVDYALLVPA